MEYSRIGNWTNLFILFEEFYFQFITWYFCSKKKYIFFDTPAQILLTLASKTIGSRPGTSLVLCLMPEAIGATLKNPMRMIDLHTITDGYLEIKRDGSLFTHPSNFKRTRFVRDWTGIIWFWSFNNWDVLIGKRLT